MAEETIFSKIIREEIPADIVYQDDLVTAFRDINPQAPTHILIIPNKLIPTVNDVTAEDELVLGRLFTDRGKNCGGRRHRRGWLSSADQLQPGRRPGGLPPAHAPAGRPQARPHAGATRLTRDEDRRYASSRQQLAAH